MGIFVAKLLRNAYRLLSFNAYYRHKKWIDLSMADLRGQAGNDFVKESIIKSRGGLLIAKLGTVELASAWCYRKNSEGITFEDKKRYIFGYGSLDKASTLKHLTNNAGFFPKDLSLQESFAKLEIDLLSQIDILGSYFNLERDFARELANSKKIDPDCYLYPFFWDNPWTSCLEGRRVLVVSPFKEEILSQYKKRQKLFNDASVLPEFDSLTVLQAVQTSGGNIDSRFSTWFEALNQMKSEIDKLDFDIALLGCGAYGLPLANYVKEKGKIAVYLGGALQLLFGIYGERWAKDPKFSTIINANWVRPLETSRPKNAKSIEKGCYW